MFGFDGVGDRGNVGRTQFSQLAAFSCGHFLNTPYAIAWYEYTHARIAQLDARGIRTAPYENVSMFRAVVLSCLRLLRRDPDGAIDAIRDLIVQT